MDEALWQKKANHLPADRAGIQPHLSLDLAPEFKAHALNLKPFCWGVEGE